MPVCVLTLTEPGRIQLVLLRIRRAVSCQRNESEKIIGPWLTSCKKGPRFVYFGELNAIRFASHIELA